MKLIVKGRHMVVTDSMREYAEEKVGRVTKFLDGDHMTSEVELWVEKNPSIANSQVAEVTVYTKGPVIRAREAATDMYAAIDLVSEKLERQFHKYKGKIVDRHTGRRAATMAQAAEVAVPGEEEQPEPTIVKTKTVELKPMTPEEAALQMELLGHDFFVFSSAETDAVSVLYRRRDGDYGLIQPTLG